MESSLAAVYRCLKTCTDNKNWCLAAEVVLRDIWATPECGLVTDRARFEAAGNSHQNTHWGGKQSIREVTYSTYCGGNGDCSSTN